MKPIVQAMLLADHVYQDISGKFIICGVFTTFGFAQKEIQPSRVGEDGIERRVIQDPRFSGSPYVYLNLIDSLGNQEFILRYVRLEQDVTFFQTRFNLKFQDKLIAEEIMIPFPLLPQVEGTFGLELLHNGEIISIHKIHHTKIEVSK